MPNTLPRSSDQQQDERFLRYFDQMPVAMILSRPDGGFEYVNPALLRLLGYTRAEIYRPDIIVTHPDDYGINKTVRAELSRNPFKPIAVEKRYLHRSGHVIHGMLTIVAEPGPQGEVKRLISQIVDLTELKRAEAATLKAEQRFRTMFAHAPMGMALYDSSTERLIDANSRYLQIVDRSLGDITQSGWMSITHPEDIEENLRHIGALRAGEISSFKLTKRYLRPDDSVVHVDLFCTTIDTPGENSGKHYLTMVDDVTEFREAQEALLSAALVYQKSSESMMILDAAGRILAVNNAFTRRTGYSESEVLGQRTSILDSGRHKRPFFMRILRDIRAKGAWQGELWERKKNGEVYPSWVSINTINNDNDMPHRIITLSSDISEKKAAEQIIWTQANFDSLTGLPNRKLLRDRLEQEVKKSDRTGKQLALFNLDLDRFKDVNDSMGHDMGDQLLVEAARRLSQSVREADTVARHGGDEFTIIMGQLDDLEGVERVARTVLKSLTRAFDLGLETAHISTSIGITLYPPDADSADDLLKNADLAMYAAKEMGRDRFVYFTPAMKERAQSRSQLITDLRRALPERQLYLVYQPIVELSSNTICKAEALLRWRHPTRGLIGPAAFIQVAEETRMITDIGNWVFEEATRQAARLRKRYGNHLQISLNTSPAQYREEACPLDHWLAVMAQQNIAGDAMTVEITEGLLMNNGPDVISKLLALRQRGVQIAIDDFGTGYSSLSYLKKFHIDFLKIDRSFVSNLAPQSDELALCEAIIAMAHKLGIRVIAEGVETSQQRALLEAAGCDFGQGYLFAEPLALADFEHLLTASGAGQDD